MLSKRLSYFVLAILLFGAGSIASAELAKRVQSELKGKILVHRDPLPASPGDDDQTLAEYKKYVAPQTLEAMEVDGAKVWAFHYLAVLKTLSPSSQLAFDFYQGKELAARKVMLGWNQKLTVLRGQISISEDDGLKAGTTYDVRLVALRKNDNDLVLAKTKLTAAPLPAPKKTSQR
jgi:hypothetical protein